MTARPLFPFFLIGLLLISILSNGFLMVMAQSDPSFSVEPHYYEKAVRWDEHQDLKRKSISLGWHCNINPSNLGLVITLTDSLDHPIQGAKVKVEAFHLARAQQRSYFELTEEEPGQYVIQQTWERSGIWEFRVEAISHQSSFLFSERHEIR